jgi:hypothetical protein
MLKLMCLPAALTGPVETRNTDSPTRLITTSSKHLMMTADAHGEDWDPTSWRSKKAAQVSLLLLYSLLLCRKKTPFLFGSFDRQLNILTRLIWPSTVPTPKLPNHSLLTHSPSSAESWVKSRPYPLLSRQLRYARKYRHHQLSSSVSTRPKLLIPRTLILLYRRSNDFGIN